MTCPRCQWPTDRVRLCSCCLAYLATAYDGAPVDVLLTSPRPSVDEAREWGVVPMGRAQVGMALARRGGV